MKRNIALYTTVCMMLCLCLNNGLKAQTLEITENTAAAEDSLNIVIDSIIKSRPGLVNNDLEGKNIFTLLGEKTGRNTVPVKINQSDSVFIAMMRHTASNGKRSISGFRLRIFLDNRQSARKDSEQIEKEFILKYPQYPTYRSYSNPYFKVTIGDFRTKSEALKALNEIKKDYPAAFIVKENILSFPAK